MLTQRKESAKSKPKRLEYLKLLVAEFEETRSQDARHQVLANLANFAYDPGTYIFLRALGIPDLFLDHLTDADEVITEFSVAGLCNLCLDPINKEHILKNDGVRLISGLLESQNINILLSAVTTLIYLITPNSKKDITNINIIKYMVHFSNGNEIRLKNLAQIFLNDYCTRKQLEEATQDLHVTKIEDIPLPNS